MKVTLNIEKRYAYTIVGLLIVLVVALAVNASYTSVPNPGHGADTVWVNASGQEMTLQSAIDGGLLGGGGAPTMTTYLFSQNSDESPLNTNKDLGVHDVCLSGGSFTLDRDDCGSSDCRNYNGLIIIPPNSPTDSWVANCGDGLTELTHVQCKVICLDW